MEHMLSKMRLLIESVNVEVRRVPSGSGRGLPVCGIFGLSFATRSAVTAIEPVAEGGFLPSHEADHLVQVQDPSLGRSYICQAAKQ